MNISAEETGCAPRVRSIDSLEDPQAVPGALLKGPESIGQMGDVRSSVRE